MIWTGLGAKAGVQSVQLAAWRCEVPLERMRNGVGASLSVKSFWSHSPRMVGTLSLLGIDRRVMRPVIWQIVWKRAFMRLLRQTWSNIIQSQFSVALVRTLKDLSHHQHCSSSQVVGRIGFSGRWRQISGFPSAQKSIGRLSWGMMQWYQTRVSGLAWTSTLKAEKLQCGKGTKYHQMRSCPLRCPWQQLGHYLHS